MNTGCLLVTVLRVWPTYKNVGVQHIPRWQIGDAFMMGLVRLKYRKPDIGSY